MKVGFVEFSFQFADYWDYPWHFVLTWYLALFGRVRDWNYFLFFFGFLILSANHLRGFSVVVLNHSKDGGCSPKHFSCKFALQDIYFCFGFFCGQLGSTEFRL